MKELMCTGRTSGAEKQRHEGPLCKDQGHQQCNHHTNKRHHAPARNKSAKGTRLWNVPLQCTALAMCCTVLYWQCTVLAIYCTVLAKHHTVLAMYCSVHYWQCTSNFGPRHTHVSVAVTTTECLKSNYQTPFHAANDLEMKICDFGEN